MRLVSPVYSIEPMTERIIEFKGLNKRPVIDDGEMRDMLNMSCDDYPCLTQRKPRAVYSDADDPNMWADMDLQAPVSMIQKGTMENGVNVKKLAVIDLVNGSYVFKYDGVAYPGLSLSADTQMVAINTRICFFPEKLWFNVLTRESGTLEAETSAESITVKSDGGYYQELIFNSYDEEDLNLSPIGAGQSQTGTITDSPMDGSTLSCELHTLMAGGTQRFTLNFKRGEASSLPVLCGTVAYDGDRSFTLQVESSFPFTANLKSVTYISENTSSGAVDLLQFSAGDVVNIYGALQIGDKTFDYTSTPASCLIEMVEGIKLYILDGTFIELSAEGVTTASMANVRIERKCPDLKYVIEYNNRLWGLDNANNEIRASKQGDPTNWNYYQGTSIDSYAATQGTDGEWTGAAAYSNHLLFFKEDYIHKVYGTKPSLYQIETATCYGLEKGSSKSVQIVNDTVFYKSRVGIMAYSGGAPVLISGEFGDDVYKNVISGQDGRKYYCSMETEAGAFEMLAFDVESGLWHKEDASRATDFCYYKGKLLMLINGSVMYADASTGESGMQWAAEFGPFDEYVEYKKIYSKIRMNLVMSAGSTVTVKIKIDNEDWQVVNELSADEYKEENTIVVPRRCDRYGLRLEGTGKVQIRTLTRQYRMGTDRRDVIR